MWDCTRRVALAGALLLAAPAWALGTLAGVVVRSQERGAPVAGVEVSAQGANLVTTGNDAEHTKGINYIGLVPVMIKALQEQQDLIGTLETENAALRERDRAFEARLVAMELALQKAR